MRRRNLMLSGPGVAALLLSGLTLSACDSTVGLDPTRPTFTKVLVPGACSVQDDLGQVEWSVMLLDGTNALLPDSRIAREIRPVQSLLTTDSFSFQKATEDLNLGFSEPAVAVADSDPSPRGVGLQPTGIRFAYAGGEERKNDARLVVLMLDHSGSLVGADPFTGQTDLTKGSDPDDQRIAFFSQLVQNLPRDYYLSLVSFSGDFPNIDPEVASPTQNRDVILNGPDGDGKKGLNSLQFEEVGTTPLARALTDSLARIIDAKDNRGEYINADLNPVVVLFTDGVESGDPSGSLEEAINAYTNRRDNLAPVPVVVLHRQPPATSDHPRGRNPDLVDLACRTGGEYIFLERATEFTESPNLQSIVQNRIRGVWRLETSTGLSKNEFEPDGYLVSTQLTVTLGERQRTAPLTRSQTNGGGSDTRIWFYKQ